MRDKPRRQYSADLYVTDLPEPAQGSDSPSPIREGGRVAPAPCTHSGSDTVIAPVASH